jgi:pimeloyl-ACP methyl ester carboxylesterase/DNA-binding CsgD family transcriptional regulator
MEPKSIESDIYLSDLIGLIYEAANDLSVWPLLLERLVTQLEAWDALDGVAPGPPDVIRPVRFVSMRDRAIYASLAAHFTRGRDFYQALSDVEEECNLLEGLVDRIPLGMAIAGRDGFVFSMNRHFAAQLRSTTQLSVRAGLVISTPRQALETAIHRVIDGQSAEELVRLGNYLDGSGVSLWVSCASPLENTNTHAQRAIILVASRSARALSVEGIAMLFGLTTTEARLTQHLSIGRTLDEAANDLEISANTAKTHLKRVFAKVGVRRQSELVQSIYASPLWLEPRPGAVQMEAGSIAGRYMNVRGTPQQSCGMRLPDQRWLAWSDNGPENGMPVIFMSGLVGSRYLSHPDDSLLMELGIRLIIPERPGTGDSTAQPNRQIADWPADVRAMADAIGLDTFHVLGYSAGTPYALVCAQQLGARLRSVTLVAAIPPFEGVADLRNYASMFRTSLFVGRYAPSLLVPMARVFTGAIKKNVYRYIEQNLKAAAAFDRAIFADARFRAVYAIGLLNSVKNSEGDIAREMQLIAEPWHFNLDAYPGPITFWHGRDDTLVPMEIAQELFRQIPRSCFQCVDGAGHYLIFSHWQEILNNILHTV